MRDRTIKETIEGLGPPPPRPVVQPGYYLCVDKQTLDYCVLRDGAQSLWGNLRNFGQIHHFMVPKIRAAALARGLGCSGILWRKT